MPEISEKTVERMRKLKNHAESAQKIGSQDEADAFMQRLFEMLAKNKMDLTDIELEEEKLEPLVNVYFDPAKFKVEVKQQKTAKTALIWLRVLAQQVGESYACDVAGVAKCNWIVIHGRRDDATAARDTLGYLAQAGMQLAMRSYRAKLDELRELGVKSKSEWATEGYTNEDIKNHPQICTEYHTKDYKSSFLYGFVARIHERLAESRVKLETSCETGLMRLDQALVRAKESLKSQVTHEVTQSANATNGVAYLEGRRIADQQQLRPSGALQE